MRKREEEKYFGMWEREEDEKKDERQEIYEIRENE